ncbi:MAG: hypothetical protein AAF380_00060 [Bacteroidota bacterium]
MLRITLLSLLLFWGPLKAKQVKKAPKASFFQKHPKKTLTAATVCLLGGIVAYYYKEAISASPSHPHGTKATKSQLLFTFKHPFSASAQPIPFKVINPKTNNTQDTSQQTPPATDSGKDKKPTPHTNPTPPSTTTDIGKTRKLKTPKASNTQDTTQHKAPQQSTPVKQSPSHTSHQSQDSQITSTDTVIIHQSTDFDTLHSTSSTQNALPGQTPFEKQLAEEEKKMLNDDSAFWGDTGEKQDLQKLGISDTPQSQASTQNNKQKKNKQSQAREDKKKAIVVKIGDTHHIVPKPPTPTLGALADEAIRDFNHPIDIGPNNPKITKKKQDTYNKPPKETKKNFWSKLLKR